MPVLVIVEPFFACSVVVLGNIAVDQLSDFAVYWNDNFLTASRWTRLMPADTLMAKWPAAWINVDTYRDDWPRQFHPYIAPIKRNCRPVHRQWWWQRPRSPV